MATNGILDITTEEYMDISPEEHLDIIKTLTVLGVEQANYGDFEEEFREWKKRRNGTFDMFLEEKYELPPGTITKIKTEKQVAQGPEDVLQTQDEMSIGPGSGDMQEILQSVGAPQRVAQGGRIGYAKGSNRSFGESLQDQSWMDFDRYNDETETGRRYIDEEDAILEKFGKRFPNLISDKESLKQLILELQAERIISKEGLGLAGLAKSLDAITHESLDRSIQGISRHGFQGEDVPEEIFNFNKAQGGRIGYADGDFIYPQRKPDVDPREDTRSPFLASFGINVNEPRYQALSRDSINTPHILPQHRPSPDSITTDTFKGGVASSMPGGLDPYSGQQVESWGQPNEVGVQGFENVDMRIVYDFLMKLGMEINDENIQRAVEALGVASQYGGEMEEREPAAFGGIMDSNSGRRAYGLGSVFKSITKPFKKAAKAVKKVLKSDLGKMAMLYIATAGMSNYMAGAPQGWNWRNWVTPKAFKGNLGTNWESLTNKLGWDKVVKPATKGAELGAATATNIAPVRTSYGSFLTGKDALEAGGKKIIEGAAPWYKGALPWIGGASVLGGLYTAANPGDVQFDTDKRDEEVNKWTQWLAAIQPKDDIVYPYPNYAGAQGGRVGRQEGGIMNLGGGEKDYRNTGGFVDIGAKEKADDVPARLSVNEFVMTADAVRGAGDGDVDEGAERLQRTMKQLEQKGKRHKAAQGMFATSQRLGEVI